MDVLLPALVAVLIAQVGDRPALLAAILADRFARAGVAIGAVAAQLLGFVLAAIGGSMLAPAMNADARALFVALALGFGAVALTVRPRIRDRLESWRLGGVATSFLGSFILAFGEASQFLVLAFATWGEAPVLAATGAALAAAAVTVAATSLGERRWRRLPLTPLR